MLVLRITTSNCSRPAVPGVFGTSCPNAAGTAGRLQPPLRSPRTAGVTKSQFGGGWVGEQGANRLPDTFTLPVNV